MTYGNIISHKKQSFKICFWNLYPLFTFSFTLNCFYRKKSIAYMWQDSRYVSVPKKWNGQFPKKDAFQSPEITHINLSKTAKFSFLKHEHASLLEKKKYSICVKYDIKNSTKIANLNLRKTAYFSLPKVKHCNFQKMTLFN